MGGTDGPWLWTDNAVWGYMHQTNQGLEEKKASAKAEVVKKVGVEQCACMGLQAQPRLNFQEKTCTKPTKG